MRHWRGEDWPYVHWLYAGPHLLIETVHKNAASLYVDLRASKSRIDDPEDWATHLAVNGVLPDQPIYATVGYTEPREKPEAPPYGPRRPRVLVSGRARPQ